MGKTDGNVAKRVEEHKNDDLTVGEKMRTEKTKYKTLHSGLTKKEAENLEKQYRPHGAKIGWNDKGGG